jgi:hypothetical protein
MTSRRRWPVVRATSRHPFKGADVELFPRGPITEDTAPVHLRRAWYAALGSAGVMVLGGLFSASFNLLMGGLIVVGLADGMVQRSWVATAALLVYLVSMLAQAGWREGQPILMLLAAVVAYFLVQGFRATWWWRGREGFARPAS